MPPWPAKPRARMIQPPTTAPTMPTTISIRGPYPEPRIIFPVAHPAIRPTIIHQSKCIETSCSLAYRNRILTGQLLVCQIRANSSVAVQQVLRSTHTLVGPHKRSVCRCPSREYACFLPNEMCLGSLVKMGSRETLSFCPDSFSAPRL